ncbi:MAG: ACT domain-containing protein, partial [Candidatus Neomarinimicrobiota bacterium]
DDKKPRLVKILGKKMEVTPKGDMIFIENMDIPGVIGKVGTFLGSRKINIAAYLLNRTTDNEMAFAVIRVDNEVKEIDISLLKKLDGIKWVKHIKVNI